MVSDRYCGWRGQLTMSCARLVTFSLGWRISTSILWWMCGRDYKKKNHVYTNTDPGPQVEWVCIAMEMPCSSQCHHSFLKLMNCLINIVKVKVLVPQSCPTLWNPIGCSPPGSSVPGILQTRILEWVAILFSRGSFWPKDQIQVSCIASRFFLPSEPAEFLLNTWSRCAIYRWAVCST